jgi:hypothetical protein
MAAIRLPIDSRAPRLASVATPRASAALMAGMVAGTVAIVVMQWIAMVAYDESAWKLPRMMAALLRGPAALDDTESFAALPVMLGFAVHYTLSLLYALALAGVLAGLRREHAPLVGLAFGALLYLANLHGFTALFPWFSEMRTIDTLVAHGIFGLVAACAYCEFSAPRGEGID